MALLRLRAAAAPAAAAARLGVLRLGECGAPAVCWVEQRRCWRLTFDKDYSDGCTCLKA